MDYKNKSMKENETFTEEQLCFIRDEFACIMEKTKNANDELDIINTCNRILDCPTFDSYEQWERNTSDTWEEIEEEENNYSACHGCLYNSGNTCIKHEFANAEDSYVSNEKARLENQMNLP